MEKLIFLLFFCWLMDEMMLRRVACVSFVLGLIFLILFHFFFSVGDAVELYLGKRVRFTGEIVSITPYPGMTSFSVEVDKDFFWVEAFTANLSLSASDYVTVIGTVSDAEKKMIVAESIEYLK